MAGVPLLDPVAGAVVSMMIVKAGAEISWDAAKQLTDTAPDAHVMDSIRRELDAMQPDGVRSWSHLRARWTGPLAMVDLHVVVDSQASVSAAHTIAERVRSTLISRVNHIGDVAVHVDAEPEVRMMLMLLLVLLLCCSWCCSY